MRPLLPTLLAAALLVAVPLTTAQADQTVVLSELGSGRTGSSDCFLQAPGNALSPVADASVSPELGSRSWQVTPSAPGDLFFVVGQGASSDALDTFRIRLLAPEGAEGRAVVVTIPPGTPAGSQWVGIATITAPADDFWQWVDAEGMTLFWFEYDAQGPTGNSRQAATLADFTTQYGESAVGVAGGIGFGCDGKAFNIDALRYGAAGDVTTTDLEGAQPALTIGGPTTITAGKSTLVSGSIDAGLTDTDGLGMQLQARPFGSTVWSNVGQVVSLSGSTFSRSVAPRKQTAYRWHFLAFGLLLDTYSTVHTVKVKTAVTATIADTTLRVGQSLIVTGKTTPAKPGTTVTLFRKKGTSTIKLAASKVRSDGTYALVAKVTAKGTWSVYASVAAASGNLAGTSPVRSATVS